MIDIIKERKELESLKDRSKEKFELALTRVRPILKDVKIFGDKAIIKYTKEFDCFNITKNNIEIKKEEIKKAYKKVDKKIIDALRTAAANIKEYARLQFPKEWFKEIRKGVKVGQIIRPIDKVGCYIPGGKYQLPSSVLMTVIPAKVAGVREVVICSPPRPDKDVMLVACDIAGADRIFRVGGAQAIAGMAYGTKTIPKVDKIVGPGNIFVTAAKKLVYGDCGVDFLAGPTEIVIIAEKGNREFIAADMLAQAEHDRNASAILITTDKKLAYGVNGEINSQLKELKTNGIAKESIRKNGAIVVVDDLDSAIDIANELSPEHLEIMVEKEKEISVLKKVRNAGAIFIGEYSCESIGDYASGPNHVLPTGQFSRIRAGLSVMDFIKMPTVQEISKEGLEGIKDTVKTLAQVEGLDGHKKAVDVRTKE